MNIHAVGVRGLVTRWLTIILGGVAVIAASTPVLRAQPAGGVISGLVSDAANGKFLEGAEVSVSGTTLQTTTNREGSFSFRNVPLGPRNVSITYPGLDPQTVAVTVSAETPAFVTVRLTSEIIQMGQMVVASQREGMAQAVALQKASVQFKLVAANDQFGEISEGNVGEYLKFLPGISIDYNVNDARGVSLRGLSTSFTIVSVDGTPMAGASSVDDTRRFEFEQIAMNNVETTELFKTVTPDIPASATGGYVNFVTKSAFDSEAPSRFSYNISLSVPSSNFSFSKEGGVWGNEKRYTIRPSAELNYARKISDKLGLNFNYRISEKYDDSPRTQITWVTTSTTPTVMTTPRLQQYAINLEQKLTHREAFATKVDYRFTPDTKLMLSAQWNWYDLPFTQRGNTFTLGTSSTANGDSYTSGTGQSVTSTILQRRKYGTTWHFNGHFSHKWDDSELSILPYWSRADSKYRDTSEGFISAAATLPLSANFTLSRVRSQRIPDISIPPVTLRPLANYTYSNTATGTNLQSRPWTAIDYKNGISASFTRDLPHLRIPLSVQTGFALDTIERTIKRPDYRGAVTAVSGAAVAALQDTNFDKEIAFGYGPIEALDPYKVWATFKNNLTNTNQDLYRKFDEQNDAAFLRFDVTPVTGVLLVGGVRWEKHTLDAQAYNRTSARSVAATVDLSYDEWYPSLTVKYTPNRKLVLRGGISRTVGHPDYVEVLPTVTNESVSGAGDGSITVPDPALKPYFTINYDLSADYYLPHSGVISVSLYRKTVDNFIVPRAMTGAQLAAVAQEYGFNPALFSSGTIQTNGLSSKLNGVEVSYSQQFPFLPAPFNGLNIQVNGSYLDLDAADTDTLYSQMRAVSPKSFNFVLGYKYKRLTFTSTTNWVDDSLYGGFVNTNYFVGTSNANPALDTRLALFKAAKATTDMKLEYGFNEQFSVYLLIRNVFNSPREEYMRGYLPQYQSVRLPYRYFEFGEPHLTFGIRGRF